jgi:Spy/CpxP family protein refolding chaperone
MRQLIALALAGLVGLAGVAWADASLKSALGLSIEQARQVDAIQAAHRPKFAAKRQEQNKELRALRRARIANDSHEIARLEKVTAELHEELKQIQLHEDGEIRKLLTPEQSRKFDGYRKLRQEMVGSSRDAKDF